MKILWNPLTVLALALALLPALVLASDKPVNEICPIKDKSADGSRVVEVSVSFCCGNCLSKFEAKPLDFAAKVAAAEEGKCPLSGRDVDADQTATIKIAVCCAGCERNVKRDPSEALEKLDTSS